MGSSTTFLATATLLLLIPTAVAAQTPPPDPAIQVAAPRTGPSFDLVLEIGAEWGGDEVGKVTFTDGDTQTMRAGQGITGAFGAVVRPRADSRLGLRATAGLKWTPTAADNANIMLTRLPLELVGTFHLTEDLWAGAGYVHHARVRFDGDGFGPDLAFDSANGFTVEAGWRWAALTLTRLGYTDEFGVDYDASSVGLSAIFPVLRR